MPLRPILEVNIFDLWWIDFTGPFPSSNKKEYILVARCIMRQSGLRLSPLGETTISRCSNFSQGTSSLDMDVRGPSLATKAHSLIMHTFMNY